MAPSDYGNARVAARRARLAGDRGLREALVQAHAEVVVPTDLAGEARRVLGFLSGRPRRLVAALLRLEDGPELEAVLRGLVLRLSPERILAGVAPSPGLPPDVLGALAALPAPERAGEALASFGSPLGPAAVAGVAAARDEPRLLRLGVAVQRTIAAGVSPELRGRGEDPALARQALRLRLDHANATTLLALAAPPRTAELFLPGGSLDVAGFEELAAQRPDARRQAIAAWLRGDSTARAPSGEELEDPAGASEHLARTRERWLGREARSRPFSIAVPLAYLAARAGEARRLRLVQLGHAHGLPADTLLDLLEA